MTHLKVAPTPPKGWNSWDNFGASVTEEEIRETAQVMAQTLKPFGWNYLVVDIQWYEPQASSSAYNNFFPVCLDDYSRLLPAENRFPSAAAGAGFKPLGDFLHSLGLKFGIHIMRGIPREAVHRNLKIKGTEKRAREIALNTICPWNSDMYGVDVSLPEGQLYYDSLLELYASWGVDFIKVDDIADSTLYGAHLGEIEAIQRAIQKTQREIVLSLSPGPASLEDGAFLQKHANMWRLTDDFWDTWPQLYEMFARCEKWAPLIRPGNWPDCDMLPLGHIGLRSVDGGASDRLTRFSQGEQRTMVSLWSLFQSPLMLGGDLRDLDPWTIALLTNEAVNDMHGSLTQQAERERDEDWIIWEAQSAAHTYYGIFNVSDQPLSFATSRVTQKEALDLWQGQVAPLETLIASHDVLLLRVNKASH